jgi:pimeloyl-ACP methyl ester carboxylesterase
VTVRYLHGAAEDADIWSDLAGEGEVHLLPAHGGRPGTPLGSVAAMALDVLAALTEPAVLVGHSLGGAVAMTAALLRPELVSGLVLVTTGAVLPVSPALLSLLPERLDEALRILVSASTGGRRGQVRPGSEVHAARFEATLRRHGAEVLAVDLRACDAYDVNARLHEVAQPALVVAGQADRMTPPVLAETLAQGLDAELVVVQDAAHLVPWEAPRAVAEAVLAVAARAGTRPG